MSPRSHASGGRAARRALAWERLREFAGGALWVMPSLAALLALVVGFVMSQVEVSADSFLGRLAFQGTADDARTLLTEITGTVVTVIALVLGLTVVALQLSSTQFSPRLLRNFLRDRSTQVVLSVFIATFVYSAAGLFTVGLDAGARTEEYPRLAISGAIVLLFASLGMVVYFADHLVHSIQIDAITRRIEQNTRRAMAELDQVHVVPAVPRAPAGAAPIEARDTGYVQRAHPELLLPLAVEHELVICLRPRVGQHVIEGTVLAWVWPAGAGRLPDLAPLAAAVRLDVRIGFERTLEQDIALGIRQLIDIASKALSAAINDPYTAVQAIDHLSSVCGDLARRPLGSLELRGPQGQGSVFLPGNTFADYLLFVSGLVGRYGARDATVIAAMLRLLRTCTAIVGTQTAIPDRTDRLAAIDEAAAGLLADSEREMTRPADLERVREAVTSLRSRLREGRSGSD